MKRLPDGHYETVADFYLAMGQETNRTNVEIAEAWGVPISTANRWVKRARALGFIPPASKRCSCRCPVHCVAKADPPPFNPDLDIITTLENYGK